MVWWYRTCLPAQEMRVPSLDQEDPLEKEMATHSSILAWRIPWTEEPGGLQSMGHKKSEMTDHTHTHTRTHTTLHHPSLRPLTWDSHFA